MSSLVEFDLKKVKLVIQIQIQQSNLVFAIRNLNEFKWICLSELSFQPKCGFAQGLLECFIPEILFSKSTRCRFWCNKRSYKVNWNNFVSQGGNAESLKSGNAGKRLACGVIKYRCPIEYGSHNWVRFLFDF